MKATLVSKDGKSKGQVSLPSQFSEQVRPDLIKRAVLAIQSHKVQPYGTDPEAGKKYASKLSRRRRDYKGAYGFGISRVPRKILSYRGTRFNWQAATAPNTIGGREAHPPQVDKVWAKKINKKERRKAIRSALAASVIKELVMQRGHKVGEYPLVLEKESEGIDKTKDAEAMLQALGLSDELKRASVKSEKTGNARRRGRHYKRRIGPLLVVSQACKLSEAASNIPGVDVVEVESLNAEVLAPGCDYGRLTLYTEGAIEKMDKQKLFTDNAVYNKKEMPAKKAEIKEN